MRSNRFFTEGRLFVFGTVFIFIAICAIVKIIMNS